MVGPDRALLPAAGEARRKSLHYMALATGAAEKGVAQIYERVFRPAEKVHQPWLDRCNQQMHGALRELDKVCAGLSADGWLAGGQMSQADITVSCASTFLSEAIGFSLGTYPALARLVQHCESLPAFQSTHVAFFTPRSP
jgi:glutathione S-transferase